MTARVVVLGDGGASPLDDLAAAGIEADAVPDLAVLVAALPQADVVALVVDRVTGADLVTCRVIRLLSPAVPLLVLARGGGASDAVAALEAGADDFLTIPCDLPELLARLHARLRRGEAPAPAPLRVGALTIDREARTATLGAHELDLPLREFDLLARLAASAGHTVTRAQLMRELWDPAPAGSTKTLDVHVSRLRRRFASAGEPGTPVIRTLRGHGYALVAPVSAERG